MHFLFFFIFFYYSSSYFVEEHMNMFVYMGILLAQELTEQEVMPCHPGLSTLNTNYVYLLWVQVRHGVRFLA